MRTLLALCLLSPAAIGQGASDLYTGGITIAEDTDCIRHLTDLNGDAFVDAIGWWYALPGFQGQQALIRGYVGDGLGGFDPVWEMESPNLGGFGLTGLSGSDLADFDGDGDLDFVFMLGTKARVYYLDGVNPPVYGGEVHHYAVDSAVWNHNIQLWGHDTTGDGLSELIGVTPKAVRLVRNEGVGQAMSYAGFHILDPADNSQLSDRHVSSLLHDVDQDGTIELVVVHGPLGDVRLHVYEFDGANLFEPDVYPLTVEESSHVTAGDIDGDGDVDLVVFGDHGRMQVLRRSPAGLQVESKVIGGPATHLADIDGDGDLDGVCCGGGSTPNEPNDEPSVFHVTINDGQGNFDVASAFPGLGSQGLAGVLDIDSDGDVDLVAGRSALLNHQSVGTATCLAEANSTGQAAALAAAGSASLARADLELLGTGMPASTPGIFVIGSGAQQQPLFDGWLCVASPTRLGLFLTDSGGSANMTPDLSNLPVSVAIDAGSTRWFQGYFRDLAAAQSGANLSAGLRVTFTP